MEKNEILAYLENMPKVRKDSLAEATFGMVNRILATPGGREAIEAKKIELGLR